MCHQLTQKFAQNVIPKKLSTVSVGYRAVSLVQSVNRVQVFLVPERLDKFSKNEENLYERNVYLLHVISSKTP